MDEKDLKIQALLERIAEITQQYEEKVADFRVQITVLANEVNRLNEQQPGTPDAVEGDIVDE